MKRGGAGSRGRRWLRRGLLGLAGLLVLLLAAAGGAWLWLSGSLPQTTGTVAIAGLEAPVQLMRDRDGIVTIRAGSEHDAYLALGYAHAQDRLAQMDLMRRLGAGRLSEVIGAATVPIDVEMRTLGLYRLAEIEMEAAPPEVQAIGAAYAAGVNAFLAEGRTLPLEFQLLRYRPEPWKPADSLVWGRLMAWQLSGNAADESLRAQLARRLPAAALEQLWPALAGPAPRADAGTVQLAGSGLPPRSPLLTPSPEESNNWVVAGSRTASGKPLLANDPHLGLALPAQWYLARIETPGLTLVGVTAPGVPFLVIGHNGKVGWGFTTTQSDTQDYFVEKLLPGDPTRYQTADGPSLFDSREEIVRVRGEADRRIVVRTTQHGVVVSGTGLAEGLKTAPDEVLALAWTGLRPDHATPVALWRMGHAGNAGEFRSALKGFHAPQQNVVYADRDGHIGFVAAGLLPIRRGLADGSQQPVPGWTGQHDWTGFVPFEALPQESDPPRGWIATANNRLVGDDYPYFIAGDYEVGYRIRRIRELLEGRSGLTADDMAAMQRDSLSLAARDLLPRLLPALDRLPDRRSQAAIALLRDWTLTMDRNQAAPLIFAAWERALHRAVFAPRLGDLYRPESFRIARDLQRLLVGEPPPLAGWCDDSGTPAVENCAAQARAAFLVALDTLAGLYGDEPSAWRWGAAHRAPFEDPLLARLPGVGPWFALDVPADGADDTVNRAGWRPGAPPGRFPDTHGPSMRMILDFADLDRSRFIVAGGQSGNLLSAHRADQVERWRDGRFLTIVGGGDAVLTLRPAPAGGQAGS
ncbi:MAG: penicillin acylase family protein [Dongiaceae bacterium]